VIFLLTLRLTCVDLSLNRWKRLQTEFAQLVTENKSTIYTVCYMFSNDSEEVNDLFQEVLINLWKGIDSIPVAEQHPHMDLSGGSQHLHLGRDGRRRVKTVPLTMEANLFEDKDEGTRGRCRCCTTESTSCNPSTRPSCCCGSRTSAMMR
jgi:hypothetical protein